MPSEIDVCNMALDRLGQEPILSFVDGDKKANVCNRMYPLIRDEIQRAHPWRRMKQRALLAADATAPEFGYDYRYAMPAETLRILDIYSGNALLNDYQLEGGYILCNVSGPLQLRYIKRENDPNQWDMLTVSCVAARLAADICETLTQNRDKKNDLMREFQYLMNEAKRADGQEGRPVPLNSDDSWLTVRYNGYTEFRPFGTVS